MILQPEQPFMFPQAATAWRPETVQAFTDLCQGEQLNPVRFRKLVDTYIATQRKPSRQALIDTLKHRPKINERAAIISSITTKLNAFMTSFVHA